MTQSFNYISSARLEHLNKYSSVDRLKLLKLERKFQKYCYVPIDIPRIEPKDSQKFLSWFTEHSKPVRKIAEDVACGIREHYEFTAIDSPNSFNSIWEQNKRHDIFTVFPELKIALDALPLVNPQFTLWNSIGEVQPHRDQGVWEDLPVSFRIMLYDDNPHSTLALQHAPAVTSPLRLWKTEHHPKFILPRVDDSNTFAWNNLRTVHSSVRQYEHQKILLIFMNMKLDLDKYEDLMERSVKKYKEFTMISDHPRTMFCVA